MELLCFQTILCDLASTARRGMRTRGSLSFMALANDPPASVLGTARAYLSMQSFRKRNYNQTLEREGCRSEPYGMEDGILQKKW